MIGYERPETKAEVQASEAMTFVPKADVLEREDSYVIVAEIPGASEETTEVSLDGSELRIHAKTMELYAGKGYETALREYESGNYDRTFVIGDAIDKEGISAAVKNGILRVTLPKVKRVEARKIEVKAEK